MTEAGEKWVEKNKRPVNTAIHVQVEQAEHWIIAFCDELNKRLGSQIQEPDAHAYSVYKAFTELKRDLLGDQ